MPTPVSDATTTSISPPESLDRALEAANFKGFLTVQRSDGAPLSEEDRERLAAVLLGYDAARELDLDDSEMADLAAKHSPTRSRRATGTDDR